MQSVSVYSTASTSSTVLKSYPQGRILLYRTYNNAWYQATVYVNGQGRTGFISATDVETINPVQISLKGIGVMSPTKVYASATTNSRALKVIVRVIFYTLKPLLPVGMKHGLSLTVKPKQDILNEVMSKQSW